MVPGNFRNPFQEELALATARRDNRAPAPKQLNVRNIFLERPWLLLRTQTSIEGTDSSTPCTDPIVKDIAEQRVRILTWNLLAQCLIRRELFPTSKCLKAAQREDMLYCEMLFLNADILCLQEVDRLNKLIPVLENANYVHCFAAGRWKQHGCLVAFKKELYTLVSEKVVHYDEEEVQDHEDARSRRASSFHTRNIALLVALQSTKNSGQGLVVATTHLFWHPKYTYERIRQAGLLLENVRRFNHNISVGLWPCIVAGDFNFSPKDPGYSLLTGDTLFPEQEALIEASRVVHISVDPTVSVSAPVPDNSNESSDPDRNITITNARLARPDDALLTNSQLTDLFFRGHALRSVYSTGLQAYREMSPDSSAPVTYGERTAMAYPRKGFWEPDYTSYAHYWKDVLDYIFILDPPTNVAHINGILSPHCAKNLLPGLPQKGVCGSDHICLAASLTWLNPNEK